MVGSKLLPQGSVYDLLSAGEHVAGFLRLGFRETERSSRAYVGIVLLHDEHFHSTSGNEGGELESYVRFCFPVPTLSHQTLD